VSERPNPSACAGNGFLAQLSEGFLDSPTALARTPSACLTAGRRAWGWNATPRFTVALLPVKDAMAIGAEHFTFRNLLQYAGFAPVAPDRFTQPSLLGVRVEVMEVQNTPIRYPAVATRLFELLRLQELA
jgi:hypothetical protein